MQLEVKLNNTTDSKAHYVTWAPAPCEIKVTDAEGATGSVSVQLRNRTPINGGQIVFYQITDGQLGDPIQNLQLDLPTDGTSIQFYVGGDYPHASVDGQDAAIEVVDSSQTRLSTTPLMVRIRKNADGLSPTERELYRETLIELKTSGKFDLFTEIHQSVDAVWSEIHSVRGSLNISFLAWHRAFILHYERELQQIEPNVALPYWRFDQPTSNVFTRAFMGRFTSTDIPEFDQTNELRLWKVKRTSYRMNLTPNGINRLMYFGK